MMKKKASEAIKHIMPILFLSFFPSADSFLKVSDSSGFSGWVRSQRGRRPWMGGSWSKLCSAGGEDAAHSKVQAFQGLSPAVAPRRRLTNIFHIKTRTENPRMKAPIVEIRLSNPQPGKSG